MLSLFEANPEIKEKKGGRVQQPPRKVGYFERKMNQ
jgi:hypothetical protein